MTLTPTDAEIEAVAEALADMENMSSVHWREHARAAFAALPATIQRVPEGWCVVPREPTDGMIEAWANAAPYPIPPVSEPDVVHNRAWATADYKAMIAASPSHDPVKGEEG